MKLQHQQNSKAVPECDVQTFRRLNADAAAFHLEASCGSGYHGHFGQLPFGSRAQAMAKAESESLSMSRRNHKRACAEFDSTPPPLPFVFVKDMSSYERRSHRLKR